MMHALGARQVATRRHTWPGSMHAVALCNRVLELRYPRCDMEVDHDPNLIAILSHLTRAESDAEFSLGMYTVLKPALIAAYQAYLERADELNDAPSIYQLSHILIDEQDHLADIAPVLAGLPPDEVAAAQPWVDHLHAHLAAIGGRAGDGPRCHHAGRTPGQQARLLGKTNRHLSC